MLIPGAEDAVLWCSSVQVALRACTALLQHVDDGIMPYSVNWETWERHF